MKKKNAQTLADKIAGVLTAAPKTFDPEDERIDDTQAKVSEDIEDENDDEEELLSKFRKQSVDLLAEVDEKYAGKKGSRKSLQDSNSEDTERESEDEESEEEMQNSDDNTEVDKDTDVTEDIDEEQSDNEESGSEYEEEDDLEEENDNFKTMKGTDVSSQVQKGLCVRNQMTMWETLLEIRIQLQKCLITANKLPQKQQFNEIKKENDFSNKANETKNSLCNVLDKMLLLQNLVQKKYPETKNLDKYSKVIEDPMDEDIPSDTEDEQEIEEEENEASKKKRKLTDYENDISSNHKRFKNFRDNVIEKWNSKTRIAVTKGNTNSHSVLNQIEHNLSDKSRLIKRTQLKRSNYKILGEEDSTNLNENEESTKTEEYNTEIFDDDDFYHQLLRELIEVKSADITDPVQLGRQWIQLQNLRSKMKRKIDTRATKGRKIRYAVHSKLVNFMAPIDEHLWTDEAKNELYNSLFGKNKRVMA